MERSAGSALGGDGGVLGQGLGNLAVSQSPSQKHTQRAQRSKKIEISSEIQNFERECKFRASHPPRPYFVGKSRRRD